MRSLLAAVAVLLLVLIGGYWWGSRTTPPPDNASVVAQVQRLNQLTTVRYTIQRVVGVREPKQPVGEESILLIVQATVEAGIRMDEIKPSDVTRSEDGKLVIRIPPPEILTVAIDEKATRVWDRQKTWWTPWIPYSPDLEGRARREGLISARNAAIEMGILKQAEANAQAAIQSLLTLSGAAEVIVLSNKTS